MIHIVLWALSFVGLWITLIWLNFIQFQEKKVIKQRKLPCVSIVVPAYNAGLKVAKTVDSIAALDYPKEKIEIIIVNDGSTDNTAEVAKNLARKYNDRRIVLLNKKINEGKVSAVNSALAIAKGELFSCMDADSTAEPEALKILVNELRDAKTAAAIPVVKIENPRNIYEKIQRIEYVLANFIRHLMSSIDTLFLTHGVLAVFRTDLLRQAGGFRQGGMTEDLEIALRLRKKGYSIKMASKAVVHTSPPNNFKKLWRQRIRWYRGFIYNHWHHRELFLRKNLLLSRFQLPLNIISIVLPLSTSILVGYGVIKDLFELAIRIFTIDGYFKNHLIDFPNSVKEYILSQNIQIILPIIITFVVGVYFLSVACRRFNEKLLRNAHTAIAYFVVMPYLTTIHWISAIVQELAGLKRKW